MTHYLIIGNLNAVTYKEVFPLFKDRKMGMGGNHIKGFEQPDGSKTDKIGDLSRGFTNLTEEGVMGVPITFLDKYCPDQFEIIGIDRYVEDNPYYGHRFKIKGQEIYARVLIKKKNESGKIEN